MEKILWDKKITPEKIKKILKDESNPRFIEFAALLLSRTNNPKEIFDDWMDKVIFCRNWQKIKRKMRTNKWSDKKIIFWDEVYKVVVGGLDKARLRSFKKRILTVDPEIKALCDKIKEIRKNKGLTQVQLARKAHLSQQTISFIEQGYVNISIKNLKKITDALGVKIHIS